MKNSLVLISGCLLLLCAFYYTAVLIDIIIWKPFIKDANLSQPVIFVFAVGSIIISCVVPFSILYGCINIFYEIENYIRKKRVKHSLLRVKDIIIERISSLFRLIKENILIVGILLIFIIPRVYNGLSSAEAIVKRQLYKSYKINYSNDETNIKSITSKLIERSETEIRSGAICMDGWHSKSSGPGTCSHHGGVYKYKYKSVTMPYNEAKKLAKEKLNNIKKKAYKKSWID